MTNPSAEYASSPIQKMYRYPGATPFTAEQERVFFGRDQDTEQLYRLLRRESLVVLYGKSGLGKSSLLQAGIIPRFQREKKYHPVLIRFYAYSDEGQESPLARVKAALSDGINSDSLLKRMLPEEDSLWYLAKSRQMEQGERPLLIFDQFEELFGYPEQAITELLRELSELRHTGLPLRMRRVLDRPDAPMLSEEEEDQLDAPLDLRLLFAIRSDRLHLLSRMVSHLPFSMNQAYELQALGEADAKKAIIAPAEMNQPDFATPPFTYSPDALAQLMAFLQDETGRVEGILLQMLCEHYERLIEKAGDKTTLTKADIGDPEAVVRDYYQQKIAALPDADRPLASRLLEEGLVSEGIRLSLHETQIQHEYQVKQYLLDALVDSRLLRAEPFARGGYTYELSHDRLVPVVLEARNNTREAKARAELAQQQQALEAAQKKAAAERQLKETAITSARRARTWSYVAAVVALFSIALALFAWKQYSKAETALSEVVQLSLRDVDKLILQLDYEAALEKMYSLVPLEVAEDTLASALLEPAFWYGETGKLDKAWGILDSAYVLSGKRLVRGQGDLASLRRAIRELNPERDSFLEARYFPRMVLVPGGKFEMGDDSGADYEKPAHAVEVSPFKMAATETTWWQYGLYATAQAKEGVELPEFPSSWGAISGDNPVINVSWYDALAYANWLSDRQRKGRYYEIDKTRKDPNNKSEYDELQWVVEPGKHAGGYRLPTEAEWEYAARGGHQLEYAVTNADDALDDYAWYYANSGSRTRAVGQKKANSYGLYDLSGNIWEWCWDWGAYYETSKSQGVVKNPMGPGEGAGRVLRGGSWYSGAEYCRSAYRINYDPDYRCNDCGFRLMSVP